MIQSKKLRDAGNGLIMVDYEKSRLCLNCMRARKKDKQGCKTLDTLNAAMKEIYTYTMPDGTCPMSGTIPNNAIREMYFVMGRFCRRYKKNKEIKNMCL